MSTKPGTKRARSEDAATEDGPAGAGSGGGVATAAATVAAPGSASEPQISVDPTPGKTRPRLDLAARTEATHPLFQYAQLFFRAYRALLDVPADDPLSYWALARIHGGPHNVPWDGQLEANSKVIGDGRDWCTHHNVNFTAWHRCYIQLLENALRVHAKTLAKTAYGGDAAYKKAAKVSRLSFFFFRWARAIESAWRDCRRAVLPAHRGQHP